MRLVSPFWCLEEEHDEKSYKNTCLFLSDKPACLFLRVQELKGSMCGNVMDSQRNPSCQAVFPQFYHLSNSILSVSLSEDGWQTS